jgi:hypothetical protein
MAAALTPSQLLEIRRVRTIVANLGDSADRDLFKGDKGDTGPPGERGLPGPEGQRGPTGLTGPSGGPVGPKGDTGEKGDKGDTGDRGPSGGEKGDKGDTGLKGDKGDTGDTGLKGDKGDKGDTGERGIAGPQGLPGIPLGNVILVDLSTSSTLTTAYNTINAAVSAIAGASLTNQTIWLLPGIHIIQNGISIPNGCSIRGVSAQTVIIRMENIIADTTMILMGENTTIEDCTIEMTSSFICNLTGILFFGTSAFTSKIKGCNIYLNNFTITGAPTNVIGVLANGHGVANTNLTLIEAANSGSLACIENSTIQIISNYMGIKRGIVVGGGLTSNTNVPTNTNIFGIKNTNIFIKNPTVSPGGGSWCAVENNSATSRIRCFTSIISGPITASSDDYSDIAQTSGEIAIGEGTTLMNKRSRLKTTTSCLPFTPLTNLTTLFYVAIGKINNFFITGGSVNTTGYLLPGTMMIQNYEYPPSPSVSTYNFQYPIPTTRVQSTYYTITKRSILMSATVRLGKQQSTITANPPSSMTNRIFITVYYDKANNPVTASGGSKPNPTQLFLIILNDIDREGSYNSNSGVFLLEEGGQLRVSMSYTGSTGNAAEDLYVQLELY